MLRKEDSFYRRCSEAALFLLSIAEKDKGATLLEKRSDIHRFLFMLADSLKNIEDFLGVDPILAERLEKITQPNGGFSVSKQAVRNKNAKRKKRVDSEKTGRE